MDEKPRPTIERILDVMQVTSDERDLMRSAVKAALIDNAYMYLLQSMRLLLDENPECVPAMVFEMMANREEWIKESGFVD